MMSEVLTKRVPSYNKIFIFIQCQAMNPLDFDAFVMLLGYKTIELDPEDVLLEALSKWDTGHTGLISEDKLII